jgi:hypothetical protein
VRGSVLEADVRLDLDDPADAPPGRVVTDQPGTDQRDGRLERRAGQDRAIDDAQSSG